MKKNILEVCTVNEFAELLGVHPNTVYNGIKSGKIQAFRTGFGKHSKFRIYRNEMKRMAAFDAREMIDNIVNKRMMK